MRLHPQVVVVAEDELFIRILASDALIDAGFTVIQAQHAEHALNLLETHAQTVGVLFTDIHMSGTMDGLQLARHATGRWPWIAVLLTSGLAAPAAHELPEGGRFLPKPYNPAHAVRHIRELIGGN